MNAIEIRHLTKRFGDKCVLNDLSLNIQEGELVGFFGPSGCGKSTLLRIICDVMPLDSGDIRMFGASGDRRGLTAYVPQRGGLLDWKTLRQNALLGWRVMGGDPPPAIRERAEELLERFGIAEQAEQYPPQASGGERQRAAFIRALLTPTKVAALDEPVAAIDHITRVRLYETLLALVEESDSGRTVLMVSHDPEELLSLCDRVIVLSPRPASIVCEVEVPFARPRDPALKYTHEFIQLKKKLWQTLS